MSPQRRACAGSKCGAETVNPLFPWTTWRSCTLLMKSSSVTYHASSQWSGSTTRGSTRQMKWQKWLSGQPQMIDGEVAALGIVRLFPFSFPAGSILGCTPFVTWTLTWPLPPPQPDSRNGRPTRRKTFPQESTRKLLRLPVLPELAGDCRRATKLELCFPHHPPPLDLKT